MMTIKEQKVRNYQKKIDIAKTHLENIYKKKISYSLIISLLGHHFEREDADTFLIFNEDFNSADLIKILESELNSLGGQIEFESPEFDFLITDRIEKAKVKSKGLVWDIHNNDKDPYPSNPHAHEYSLNVKLHLGTGEFYRKKTIIGKLSKNEFIRLRQKISEKGIVLPSIKE
jgi:hypothetical protein